MPARTSRRRSSSPGSIRSVRVPGTGREPDLSERQLHARRRVHEAMSALGGISSLARGRAAAERARVGDPAGVGRTAGASEAGARHPGSGARDAGGALRVR